MKKGDRKLKWPLPGSCHYIGLLFWFCPCWGIPLHIKTVFVCTSATRRFVRQFVWKRECLGGNVDGYWMGLVGTYNTTQPERNAHSMRCQLAVLVAPLVTRHYLPALILESVISYPIYRFLLMHGWLFTNKKLLIYSLASTCSRAILLTIILSNQEQQGSSLPKN